MRKWGRFLLGVNTAARIIVIYVRRKLFECLQIVLHIGKRFIF